MIICAHKLIQKHLKENKISGFIATNQAVPYHLQDTWSVKTPPRRGPTTLQIEAVWETQN